MADTTLEALRSHMAKWRKQNRKHGIETNPLGDQEEALRWICDQIDKLCYLSSATARQSLQTTEWVREVLPVAHERRRR